jgi:dihydrofolate reductase
MRKIVLDLAVTLDGYIEGANGEIDWCSMEESMDFPSFLAGIDTVLFGRLSYEVFQKLKPGADKSKEEQEIWQEIDRKTKIVFSRTTAQIPGTQVIQGDLIAATEALKQEPGKDIWMFGGAQLIAAFMESDLIDEYRLSIHPVILGSGKLLFSQLARRISLQLVQHRSFSSGVVQIVYARNRQA